MVWPASPYAVGSPGLHMWEGRTPQRLASGARLGLWQKVFSHRIASAFQQVQQESEGSSAAQRLSQSAGTEQPAPAASRRSLKQAVLALEAAGKELSPQGKPGQKDLTVEG